MDKGKSEIPRVSAFVEAESRGITEDKERVALWPQLVYVTQGFLSVTTPSARYAATPGHAVFIPAGVPHALLSRRSCELLRAFIHPARMAKPMKPAVLVGNALVEQLLLATKAAGDAYADEGPEARLVQVLL